MKTSRLKSVTVFFAVATLTGEVNNGGSKGPGRASASGAGGRTDRRARQQERTRRRGPLPLKLARERGTPILMVTHDSRVPDIADRIVCTEDGCIVPPTGT